MMSEHYGEGDRFLEVTFQLDVPKRVFKNDDEIHMIVDSVLDMFPDANNIKVIPCHVEREPVRLSVSKDDSSYATFNSKQESQILEDGE